MQITENLKVKEKLYTEKLENGLTVMIIPKKEMNKKYVIFGTHFGSIDNTFVIPGEEKKTSIPDGVAHFLEHKMFEQSNGTNSLDVLSALGVDANAYTTNDHTAYLFECTDNFYPALDELMDYVQNPYFTEQNVEKEKGIIGQEIRMYDDDPATQVYMNAMKCLYKNNPVNIDIAGTVESISNIDKNVLYHCYHTFYNPSNMAMVICGDFDPEALVEDIKKRLVEKPIQGEIKRIYPQQEEGICQETMVKQMEVSNPIFVMGIKDKIVDKKEMIKRHIAIEIILNMLLGKSSNLYKKLYEEGELLAEPDLSYEFTEQYAHILISGQSRNPEKIYQELQAKITEYQEKGFEEREFERLKKKIYGDYIIEYNSVSNIARMFLADYFKGINSFEYIEEYGQVTLEYATQVFKELFKKENMVMSIVKGK